MKPAPARRSAAATHGWPACTAPHAIRSSEANRGDGGRPASATRQTASSAPSRGPVRPMPAGRVAVGVGLGAQQRDGGQEGDALHDGVGDDVQRRPDQRQRVPAPMPTAMTPMCSRLE